MQGPLDGITVLEVANWLAAPAAAALLADMGAAVVKVEPPQGDAWRYLQPSSWGYSGDFPTNYAFQQDNRGKRGISINLDHEDGQTIVRRLAGAADVFLTNLLPRRLQRYRLGYAELAALNPRLVYAAFTGYGSEGPERDRLGFDYAGFWARSGIMSLVGERDSPPPMQRSGMGDHTVSTLTACAILAALFERERTGRGQEVQTSLLNTGLWVLGADVQTALVARQHPRKHSRNAPANPLWNTYKTRDDRWLMLVMVEADRYWPAVCAALGLEELRDDRRFSSLDARQEHSAELVTLLEEAFLRLTHQEWAPILDRHGLIWALAQHLDEVIVDPQVRANHYIVEIDHPNFGRMETIDTPIRFGESQVGVRGPAPELGQHTEEVLLEHGYSWEEIGRLRDSGAIG